MRRRALVTGIGGQDGSYLADLLLANDYEVYGLVRRSGSSRFENLDHVRERIELVEANLLDQLALVDVLRDVRPHEVYNLASPSFVPTSWKQPVVTAEFAAVGVTSLQCRPPSAVRETKLFPVTFESTIAHQVVAVRGSNRRMIPRSGEPAADALPPRETTAASTTARATTQRV